MLILRLTLRFRVPWSRSLKDKRSETRRILSRLKNQFNVSVAESGGQDSLTLFELSVAALCFHPAQADSVQQSVLDFVENLTEAELYEYESDLL